MGPTLILDMAPVYADLDEVRREAQHAAEALWARAAV